MTNKLRILKKILSHPLFKLFVSLAIVTFFLITIDTEKISKTIKSFTLVSIIVIILLSILRNVIGSVRFKLILDERKVSFFVIVKQYFIASFYNNILPTAIGGDAVRMAMLTKYDLKASEAIGLITFERIIGLFAEITLAFVCCNFWNAPKMIKYSIYIIMALMIFAIFIFKPVVERLKQFNGNKVYTWLMSLLDCMIINRRVTVIALFTSLLYQGVSVFVTIYIAATIGLNVNVFTFLTILPLIWIFTMIPISFGGVGLREMSFIFLFSKVGYSNEAAMTISLGTYFSLLISGLVGAYFVIYSRLSSKVNK
jgi:glycosyltransferase 2 family protein